jgi:hypothetical protein
LIAHLLVVRSTTNRCAKEAAFTLYPDLNAVLRELVESIHSILQENFIGAYLQGSFAIGDFDRFSDVDFIIAIEQELPVAQVEALQSMHARIYRLDSSWAQHLEGSYFPKEILRRLTQPVEKLWYLDNGSQSLVQSDHCNTLVVRWTAREHGVALAGPDPATLIDPIPAEALRREILATLRNWGRQILDQPEHYNNRFYQGFIVLSYCRMLHDYLAGSVGSKRTGAEWAKENLDPCWSDLIDRAWDNRPVPEVSVRTPADPKDFRRTLAFVEYVIKEVEKQGL